VLCAGWFCLASAQEGPPEGRRGRAPKIPRDAAPAELSEPNGVSVPPVPVAESVDYTKLLEQFLKASDEQPEIYFYRCKYIAAETMRRLLENFLTPAGTVGRSDEDDIVVVSDLPSRLPQLKQIVEQADQPVAQVLVEARIVELEISNDLKRDINFGVAKTGASDSVRRIFQDLLIPNSSGSSGTEDLRRTASAGKGSDGHLWTFVGTDQVKIWAMINYLEEQGRARILSSPNLVIRRGCDGNIMTGEKVPVLSRTITGSSESIATRFENVGVKLIVRPIMISGNRIHVKVNPEVSSSSRTVDTGGFQTPVIVVRSASTELEANDGELITIGGLMRQEQRATERRVPYLADIPYLGVLFQYKQNKAFTSQIVIFMTMRLVTPGAYEAVAGQQSGGVPEDIRKRVEAIEQEVIKDNQTIWKELPK
jgi:type II secretory pathway component GspD/PulD (secretin)